MIRRLINKIRNWLCRKKIVKYSHKFDLNIPKTVIFNSDDYQNMSMQLQAEQFLIKGYTVTHSPLVPKGQFYIAEKEFDNPPENVYGDFIRSGK